MYKVIGEDAYIDANSLHESIRTRITKNQDSYKKVVVDRYGEKTQVVTPDHDPLPEKFEKVDMTEIREMKTETPGGVEIYENPVAASERSELIEIKQEELSSLPEDVQDQIIFGKKAEKLEDEEKKRKRIEVYSRWLGMVI